VGCRSAQWGHKLPCASGNQFQLIGGDEKPGFGEETPPGNKIAHQSMHAYPGPAPCHSAVS